ncbi:MAG: cytochrome P460 family protein [Emcibacter sp.]|nr:cytochrome P460 family protein [Emcibacter sp.]
MALLFAISMSLSATTGFAADDEAMNPCGMSNPCAKHNPCAKANPCAKKHNPCGMSNPCAKANPCAKKHNPCGMSNPCAKANPCGMSYPCAKHNPCGANPCGANPCAANPCGGNPCSPAESAEISGKEAAKIYKKMSKSLHTGYAKSGVPAAKKYYKWAHFNKTPYVSDTHGGREVNNYSNRKRYGKFEKAGKMSVGTILAKDSFRVTPSGKVEPGPLFLMEKKKAGYNKENGDWAYTLIMPNGMVVGTSQGKGAGNVAFCADCHNAAEDQDYLFFLPEEYRK